MMVVEFLGGYGAEAPSKPFLAEAKATSRFDVLHILPDDSDSTLWNREHRYYSDNGDDDYHYSCCCCCCWWCCSGCGPGCCCSCCCSSCSVLLFGCIFVTLVTRHMDLLGHMEATSCASSPAILVASLPRRSPDCRKYTARPNSRTLKL